VSLTTKEKSNVNLNVKFSATERIRAENSVGDNKKNKKEKNEGEEEEEEEEKQNDEKGN
jgi:hypothetical protein